MIKKIPFLLLIFIFSMTGVAYSYNKKHTVICPAPKVVAKTTGILSSKNTINGNIFVPAVGGCSYRSKPKIFYADSNRCITIIDNLEDSNLPIIPGTIKCYYFPHISKKFPYSIYFLIKK